MSEAPKQQLRLTMRGVCKRYGATIALDAVDLTVGVGEVHAVLGENGAGKSTLMKVLAGVVRPDAGECRVDGRVFDPRDPCGARAAGIAMIHQELCLAPHLSVEGNLALGAEVRFGGIMRMREIRRRATAALARLGRDDIDPQTPVRDLAPGARQMVEIARALMFDARIIVMDEPTSSLGLHDIERLFSVIATLRTHGVSVIYISHFLEEVARVADRWTVLRDGRVAAAGEMRNVTTQQLVELMIGRRLDEMYPKIGRTRPVGASASIEMRDIYGVRSPHGATVRAHSGEIVGVAGLVGAGRTEMLRCVFGLDTMLRGEVLVAGRVTRSASPAARFRSGIGMLSEDRANEGLALRMSIADNITLGGLQAVGRFGWIVPSRQRSAAKRSAEMLGARMREVTQRIGELSGGNQQKIALARLLYRNVDVLLLDEPTRGIDVGSKAQTYRVVSDLAASGKAVVFVSSSVSELLGVCDRIVVMHRGRIVAERAAADWTESDVIHAAITGRDERALDKGGVHAA